MSTPTPDSDEQLFKLPSRTYTSTILNGVGNGMMLGTAPFFAYELYANIVNKVPDTVTSRKLWLATAAAVGIGGVIGGIYGNKEADQLINYRAALNDQLGSLRQEIRTLKKQNATWADRVTASKEQLPQPGLA